MRIINKYKDLKLEKHLKQMNKKYGDYTLEDDDYKFIWGIDSNNNPPSMITSNNIDIIYDKKSSKYVLEIETAYLFNNSDGECKLLLDYLKLFTKYMDENHLNKNESFVFFLSDPCTSISADTIEELYTNFNIFVKGFCAINKYNWEE